MEETEDGYSWACAAGWHPSGGWYQPPEAITSILDEAEQYARETAEHIAAQEVTETGGEWYREVAAACDRQRPAREDPAFQSLGLWQVTGSTQIGGWLWHDEAQAVQFEEAAERAARYWRSYAIGAQVVQPQAIVVLTPTD